jgi:hypothetical protein
MAFRAGRPTLESPRPRLPHPFATFKGWAFRSIPLPPARFWSRRVITPLYPTLSLFAVAMAGFPRQNRVLVDGA